MLVSFNRNPGYYEAVGAPPHVRVEMLLLPESILANPIQVRVYN
jgi:hypothetical protein